MKSISLILAALLIGGCSTYSKKECEVKDWYQEGYARAREGQTLGSINHYQEKCTAKHGIAVNETLYTEGFNKGLEYLCTEEQGRLLGQSGLSYQGTCPKPLEDKFLKTYESGRMDFLIRKVSSLENELSDLRSRNSSLESELSYLRGRRCD